MKIWTKVHLKENSKQLNIISNSLTNYIYSYGPINKLKHKYDISEDDYKELSQYTANRIGGILLLYLAQDINRINDIANKYNFQNDSIKQIIPEIEGYINKTAK